MEDNEDFKPDKVNRSFLAFLGWRRSEIYEAYPQTREVYELMDEILDGMGDMQEVQDQWDFLVKSREITKLWVNDDLEKQISNAKLRHERIAKYKTIVDGR